MILSVVCSGYRVENFKRLYDSIGRSFSQEWELIVVGPGKPDFEAANLTWIEDFGSPARCTQRGFLAAKGKWISFATDDGHYLDGAIDGEFEILSQNDFDYKTAIAGKFYEDVARQDPSGAQAARSYQEKDDLYYIKTHVEAYSQLFRPDFLIFGQGLISKKLLMEIGGFDCRFELMGMSFLEMSVRLQMHGCKSILTKMPVFYCEWSHLIPGHEVVQQAYEQHDKALYQSMYRNPSNSPQIVVDPDNWKLSPRRWRRRFVDVSVIMPTIRTHLLQNVYDSLAASFHGSWELVLVGPNPIPQSLLDKGNVQWAQSYRSPIACRQMALLMAKGELICHAADDVTFLPYRLDEAYQRVEQENFDYKFIVAGKYLENVGAGGTDDSPSMRVDEYYHLNHHAALQKAMTQFPKEWLIVNTGLISRRFLIELGGWDCEYEVCSMACCDLSMRLQNAGARVHLQHNPIFTSTWMRDRDGDHGPIHDAHNEHDLPLFLSTWEAPEALTRTAVDINAWQKTPELWHRRFEQ